MVPAIDPRRLIAISGLTTVCVLLATAIVADEPPPNVDRTSVRATDEAASREKAAWFAEILVAQAESPSDLVVPLRTARQIRPLAEPPDAPTTPAPVGPSVDDDATPPPVVVPRVVPPPFVPPPFVSPPVVSPPDVSPPDVLSPDGAPTDDTTFTLFRRSRSRASFARRRRPIAVLGDSLIDEGQLTLQFTVLDHGTYPGTPMAASASTDIPLTAAAVRGKISKNRTVLPTDRVIFSYQHFQNALSTEITNPVAGNTQRTLDLDRLMVGFEKTFFDGQWSIDARLPVNSRFDVAADDFAITNGRLGNVAFLLKHLWYETDAMALGVGVGIDAPTGSDGRIMLPHSELLISNDAYHAQPYLGLLVTPKDNVVVQAFAQLDIPLNGNQVEILRQSGEDTLGRFDEQELLFLSLSTAYWLYQNPDATHLRGLAALLELHSTTSLDDPDRVSLSASDELYEVSNPVRRISTLNMTAGLHTQIGMTVFRAAAVVPLRGGVNRPFDAEFMFQMNRHY